MALPDISTLTETELDELARATAARINELASTEARVRDDLLSPASVQAQIAALTTASATLTTMIQGMQGSSDLKTVAQVLRRTVNNTVRLLRVAGGQLDSADLGEPS